MIVAQILAIGLTNKGEFQQQHKITTTKTTWKAQHGYGCGNKAVN